MTRIGPTPADAGRAAALHEETRARRGDERQLGRGSPSLGDGLRREMRFNQFGLGAETKEREDAFHEKIRHALRDARPGDDRSEERTRLIAAAGEAAPIRTAAPQPAAPAADDGAAQRADRGLRIDQLAQRIEEALGTELRGGRSELSLRLDLGGAEFGLASLTVAITPDTLDVVLTGAGAPLPPEAAAAAQALAERLQQRFARRVVRIHEAEPAMQGASGGMDEISRLFRGGGGS
jgi:glutathione S-transferase